MKRIGILSDTHGYIDDRILHYLSDRDEIWHAGDWGNIIVERELRTLKGLLRGVWGNIDGKEIRLEFPKVNRFVCEEVNVLMTHIGGYPGKYAPDMKAIIQRSPPNLFICGHSHIVKIIRDPKYNLIHINPGAAGRSGFHKVRTLVLLDIEGKTIKNLRVVELGTKSNELETSEVDAV